VSSAIIFTMMPLRADTLRLPLVLADMLRSVPLGETSIYFGEGRPVTNGDRPTNANHRPRSCNPPAAVVYLHTRMIFLGRSWTAQSEFPRPIGPHSRSLRSRRFGCRIPGNFARVDRAVARAVSRLIFDFMEG
jgi:hypothetical protein